MQKIGFPNLSNPLLVQLFCALPHWQWPKRFLLLYSLVVLNGASLLWSKPFSPIAGEETLLLTVEQQVLAAQENYLIHFRAPNLDQFIGFQFTLQYDATKLVLDSLVFGQRAEAIGLSAANFGLFSDGTLTSVWTTLLPPTVDPEAILFTLAVRTLEATSLEQAFLLTSQITPILALCEGGIEADMDLQFLQTTSVQNSVSSPLKLYPNPSSHQLWLSLPAFFTGTGEAMIYQGKAQLMQTTRLHFTGNSNPMPIDIQALPAGYYWLRLRIDDQRTPWYASFTKQ